MERITGIGGLFFKAQNPKALLEWYQKHLGLELAFEGGAVFQWKQGQTAERPGSTVFSAFKADTEYFNPSQKPFMVNFRVRSLEKMRAQLKALGAEVDEKTEESEFGKFGWVMDPEGNRLELWEPPEGS